MSIKNRTKFSVAGVHPLLFFVRNHFIQKGFALVSWEDDPDFCLIGAELTGTDQIPLAQLDLQKMWVGDRPVLLLSSACLLSKFNKYSWEMLTFDLQAQILYSKCAEHIFSIREHLTTVIRPCNIYGSDISFDIISKTIIASKRKEKLWHPALKGSVTSFLHQDDFLKYIDLLLVEKVKGIFNIGSQEGITYTHLLNNIWKFVNGPDTEPSIRYLDYNLLYDYLPDVENLIITTGWKPRTSLRSSLFSLINQ